MQPNAHVHPVLASVLNGMLVQPRQRPVVAEIETHVSGIPCIAQVLHAHYTRPDYNTWASAEDYFGGWEIDWRLCDQRGRPAAWLERKATDADRDRIEAELIAALGEGA